MNYEHILSFVNETPWAVVPSKLLAIMDLLSFRANGGHFSPEEIEARIGATRTPPQQAESIAVLPLYGTIIPRGNFLQSSGTTSLEGFTKLFRQAMADPSIGGVIIDVDSGGGSVAGVTELASEIYAARGIKPVTAIANNMAASAAYWIASACESLMVTPSGDVGSIGVFGSHNDISKMCEMEGIKTTLISAGKYKVEASPFGPLSDEAKEAMQSRVDEYYEAFTADVAKHRGVKLEDVQNGMGEGRIVGAKQAKRMGMIDGIGTMDDAINEMAKRMKKPMMSAEAFTVEEVAKAFDVPVEALISEGITVAGVSSAADGEIKASEKYLHLEMDRLEMKISKRNRDLTTSQ